MLPEKQLGAVGSLQRGGHHRTAGLPGWGAYPLYQPKGDRVMAQGTMEVLDHTGDTKLIWDSERKEEVKNAKRTFDDLRKKGYIAHSVKKKGGKGKVITEFDSEAERLILTPPLAGG
jgi:hypothetical protein